VNARHDHVGVARQNADVQAEQDQVAGECVRHHSHVAAADFNVEVGYVAEDADLLERNN